MFTIKLNHRLSGAAYDKIIEWARSFLLEGNKPKENFYIAKSMMKPLGLGYQKINLCPNFYMLYYLENVELTECRICDHSCYKPRTSRGRTLVAHKKHKYFLITHILQRLFMSSKTAEYMTWHQSHNTVDEVIVRLSDSESWKHFNSVHPHFLVESRNMHLRLYIDGINPFK